MAIFYHSACVPHCRCSLSVSRRTRTLCPGLFARHALSVSTPTSPSAAPPLPGGCYAAYLSQMSSTTCQCCHDPARPCADAFPLLLFHSYQRQQDGVDDSEILEGGSGGKIPRVRDQRTPTQTSGAGEKSRSEEGRGWRWGRGRREWEEVSVQLTMEDTAVTREAHG